MSLRCVLCGPIKMKGTTCFLFPKKELLRREWANFCGMQIEHVLRSHRLCSRHFLDTDRIFCRNGAIKLKNNTMPSVKSLRNRRLKTEDSNKENGYMPNIIKTSPPECGPALGYEPTKNSFSGEEMVTEVLSAMKEEPSTCDFDESWIKLEPDVNIHIYEHGLSTQCTKPSTKGLQYNEPRYIGDIKLVHVQTPRRAERTLHFVNNKFSKLRKTCKHLRQKCFRLTQKLRSMKDRLNDLKRRNLTDKEAADGILDLSK